METSKRYFSYNNHGALKFFATLDHMGLHIQNITPTPFIRFSKLQEAIGNNGQMPVRTTTFLYNRPRLKKITGIWPFEILRWDSRWEILKSGTRLIIEPNR